MKNNNVNLAPPWWQFQREMKAFFDGDPFVTIGDLVEKSGEEMQILIQCQLLDQAAVYKEMLKKEQVFARTTVKISVLGPDEDKEFDTAGMTDVEMLDLMFRYNPRYLGHVSTEIVGLKMDYCIFNKELIQFANDDSSSYALYTTEVASDVIKKFLRETRVSCCTIVENDVLNASIKKG